MIYITGDTHIPVDIGKLSSKRFPEERNLTKDDCVIICGDFGGVWDESREEGYWIKWLRNKKFSTLFIDGNHENFDLLSTLPKEERFGGEVRKVSEGIYHLLRGEIYNICGKVIFTFGGGSSHDKEFRTEGKNWWSKELPTEKELRVAREKLSGYNGRVDYIITHSAPTSIQRIIAPDYEENILTDFLDELKDSEQYEKWFFGHYHKDLEIDPKHIAVFDRIIAL